MRIDAVVINASPLITLFRSGQSGLLPRLFKQIVVPETVWREVVVQGQGDRAARELSEQSWPVRVDVVSSPRVAAWDLGAGETAVLSHALVTPPLRAVIDDMDARRCARTLGTSALRLPMLTRHSSRRSRLDQTVLNQRLDGAVAYDRIAGYFRSSLFEVAGEAIASVAGPVRIVCNSDLDPQDLVTAAAAQAALRRSWCSGKPEEAPPAALPRYRALYAALTSKRSKCGCCPIRRSA
jgi:predicted nucleic acid-binding protein